jgi:diacylglycerol kinase (ATP)
MIDFIKARLKSFQYAFAGVAHTLQAEGNTRVHALFSLFALATGSFLNISRIEWMFIIGATTAVWMAEFFNTAIEAVVDLYTQEQHPLAKISKDAGAAAVLITAGAATLIGVIIFGPPIWNILLPFFKR